MNSRTAGIFLLTVIMTAFSSCAKDETIDSEEAQDRILSAWIKTYHPDATQTDSGVYILDYSQGTGEAIGDTAYVFVHYTKKSLSGDISASNIEDVNKKIGGYTVTDYYGSDIWRMGIESVAEGLEEVIMTMKVGGKATVAVPVGMSTVSNTLYNAFSNASEDVNYIYEVEIEKQLDDITGYEIEQLENFRDVHYPGLDSTRYGFYFKKLKEMSEEDTIVDETTINVWYIGKRLDGTVFDTNIEDTAKFYRMYDEDSDYEELEVTFYKDMDDSAENNETVAGFSYAVSQLRYGEEIVAFFYSDLGYEAAGSETKIGEHAPLFFYIKLDDDDD